MVTNTDDISLRCDHVTSDDASSVTGNDDNHNNNTDDDSQKIRGKSYLRIHSVW